MKDFAFPYYLLLLPVFFVFHGYTDYYNIIYLKDALWLMAQYCITALAFCVLFYFVFRSWQKTALFSFTLLCFQFFFGSLHDTAKTLLGDSFLATYSFILPASLALLILLFFFIKKSNRSFSRLATYLTVAFAVLIMTDFILLVPKAHKAFTKTMKPPTGAFVSCDSCARPDVYFIVADEYAGQEQLKTLLHFDNSAFEHELRTRGFQVVKNSRSNYNSTPFSIASLVNMEYLAGIEGNHNSKADIQTCYDKINRNAVAAFFKKEGYEIKSHSIFNFADIPTTASITLFPIKAKLISGQTFLSRLYRDLAPGLIVKWNYRPGINKILYTDLENNRTTFQQVWNEVTTSAGRPRFIYAHLMMPHDPYYFDKNGKLLISRITTEGPFGQEDKYVSYLQYSNKKFLELIDHIQTRSTKPPIIIFMSDHGFRYYNSSLDTQYQFMNVNAVYLPNHRYEGFYNGMSNVNQFRVLLNTAFRQNLPLLKDSTIVIK